MTLPPRAPTSRNGRAAYLQLREEVEARLRQGATLTVIYREISGHLPFSYQQFAKYVRRFSLHACPAPYRPKRKTQPDLAAPQRPPEAPPPRPPSARPPAPAEQGEARRDSAKVGETMRLF